MTADDPKPLPKTGPNGWERTASARAKEWCKLALERGELLAWEWQEKDMQRRMGGKTVHWKADFFGFADLVMVRQSPIRGTATEDSLIIISAELVAVQVTGGPATSGDGAKRVRKIQAEPKARAWAACGAKIEVWEFRWRKQNKRFVAVERVVIPVELERWSKS